MKSAAAAAAYGSTTPAPATARQPAHKATTDQHVSCLSRGPTDATPIRLQLRPRGGSEDLSTRTTATLTVPSRPAVLGEVDAARRR